MLHLCITIITKLLLNVIKQEIITVKSCDNIINNALPCIGIFNGWIIVSHKVRLNTCNITTQAIFTIITKTFITASV